ncbi:SBBP repeat-containing protein [Aureispira anguillae]|uniref:SBBP repeat-containing protein n=1 Tax=Aureispira anguillae TaxID=2864201 RepID=A0A915YFA6_9BACT|nr:SBBP repeat-containing protein [Aureispira anguillae]BDS11941.1 SBBP repeat-containing protein [Aureispira anguillae]
MYTHLKYIILLTFIYCSPILAQNHSFSWAKQAGGNKADEGKSIAIDNDGNVYTTGEYSSNGDFDPGTGVFNLTTNDWNYQIFVQKLTPDGDLIWAKSFGGNGYDHGEKIRLDADGNIYVTGWFENTVDFAGFTKTASGLRDIFLLKMSSSGTVLWVETFGGAGYTTPNDLIIDDAMNIYMTGGFSVSATFGSQTFTSNGAHDAFVLKMDQGRNLQWVNTLGGNGSDIAISVEVDRNKNVYTTGAFTGTVDFDPSSNNSYYLSSTSSVEDTYIQKLDSAGHLVWAKSFGADWEDHPYDIHLDKNEDLYIIGRFGLTIDFDLGPNTFFLTGNGSLDAYLLKIDTAGQFIWAKSWGASSDDYGMSVTTDDEGNVYTGGYFFGFVDFDPGPNERSLWSKGNGDFFLTKLTSNGDFLWAKSGGGPVFDIAWEIALNPKKELYMVGEFTFTGNFHTDFGTYNMTANSNGHSDVLLLKLDYCAPSDSTLVVASCEPYLAPNNQTYDSSGQYIVRLSNAKGCDSILTINLTRYEIPVSLFSRNDSLFAVTDTNLTYKWYDCQSQTYINNETAPFLRPSNSGSYAVEVSNGQCSVRSSCFLLDLNLDLLIYPNPTAGNISINKNHHGEITAKVYDAIGELIGTALLDDQITTLDLSRYPSGVYMLVLEHQQGISTHKIIRE